MIAEMLVGLVGLCFALAFAWMKKHRDIALAMLDDEKRAHGDTKAILDKSLIMLAQARPTMFSARQTMKSVQESLNAHAAAIAEAKKAAYQTRLMLRQVINRGTMGEMEAKRVLATAEAMLAPYEMDGDAADERKQRALEAAQKALDEMEAIESENYKAPSESDIAAARKDALGPGVER